MTPEPPQPQEPVQPPPQTHQAVRVIGDGGVSLNDDAWLGTSDSDEVMRRRVATTAMQRLAWLHEALLFASLTGALQADRRRRQQRADEVAVLLGL